MSRPVDLDPAGGRLHEAADETQQRALPGSTAAEYDRDPPASKRAAQRLVDHAAIELHVDVREGDVRRSGNLRGGGVHAVAGNAVTERGRCLHGYGPFPGHDRRRARFPVKT